MHYLRVIDVFKTKPVGLKVEIKGWVKSFRSSKNVSFVDINDGSCLKGIQAVIDDAASGAHEALTKLATGCSVLVRGTLVDSPAKGQEVELQVEYIEVIGESPDNYPLQKKRHSFEFLREIAHLRARTNSLGAVFRVRSALSFAVHNFFNERGFVHVHTPIISTGDCEGAGETFTVTAFDLKNVPLEKGAVDWRKDFFGEQANLTVSGQLEAEAYALALGNVYTFGPTFRAEDSNTSRHLAEFWMVEPEMAFCDLTADIDVAEEFLKYLIGYCISYCEEDIILFGEFIDTTLLGRLELVLSKPFARISYTEAIEILNKAKVDFTYPVFWGVDLQSEHERYLAEQVFELPVVLTDYPKEIKPFYMRANNDGRTVAAMDILFPGIGEMVGGSQREERVEVLTERMEALAMDLYQYQWYLDLRRYGSVPHAGFGLGFERIVQFCTGMKNIRDVIPFPRTPGSAGF
nr:asparagine--tRNA ligase [Desulfobulbaceae bacterium]